MKGLDYPFFYKNGTRYTAVWGKSKFTEVHLTQTFTKITSGSNVHIVDDAKAEEPIGKDDFDRAYSQAILKIQVQ